MPLLTLLLEPPTLARYREGRHGFFKRLTTALTEVGWQVETHEDTPAARRAGGFQLRHMAAPHQPQALTCRRSYVGSFWHIEAEAERWRWPVARAPYLPTDLPEAKVSAFAARLRQAEFGSSDVPPGGGGVLVPLQGHLARRRSFQSLSPLEMVETLAARLPDRDVRVTLHPKERATTRELAALERLTARHPRLRVQRGGTHEALRGCDLVATQNSATALLGYLLHKPALLFAEIDFHHIAASVPRDGLDAAFAGLGEPLPDFDRYLWWFLQEQAINAGAPQAEAQIRAALAAQGWPVAES